MTQTDALASRLPALAASARFSTYPRRSCARRAPPPIPFVRTAIGAAVAPSSRGGTAGGLAPQPWPQYACRAVTFLAGEDVGAVTGTSWSRARQRREHIRAYGRYRHHGGWKKLHKDSPSGGGAAASRLQSSSASKEGLAAPTLTMFTRRGSSMTFLTAGSTLRAATGADAGAWYAGGAAFEPVLLITVRIEAELAVFGGLRHLVALDGRERLRGGRRGGEQHRGRDGARGPGRAGGGWDAWVSPGDDARDRLSFSRTDR